MVIGRVAKDPVACPIGYRPAVLKWSLHIPNRLNELSRVRRFVEWLSAETGFDGSDTEEITIAVHEACSNAMRHGAPRQAFVKLICHVTQSALVFIVMNEGRYINRRSPRCLFSESGRGIKLIKAFMDSTKLKESPGGCKLIMARELPKYGAINLFADQTVRQLNR